MSQRMYSSSSAAGKGGTPKVGGSGERIIEEVN
jgi:hypothetical protein